jgi:D-alanine-D-alanine ligase
MREIFCYDPSGRKSRVFGEQNVMSMTRSSLRIAFVYTSKSGMEKSLKCSAIPGMSGDSEVPPDLLAECDSDETIQAVHQSIAEKYQVVPVESDENAFQNLERAHPDLVFNISERLWGPNRESHIPTVCEILGLPYTGSDPLTLGICLVKSRAKEILSYYGIPNPKFWIVEPGESVPIGIPLPSIVKPLYEGSSKGIRDANVVKKRTDLKEMIGHITSQYKQPVIVEKFLKGREFTVGVLGNNPDYEVLPIVEINHHLLPKGANPIYSYEAKWIWDTPDRPLEIFTCPAKIPKRLEQRICEIVSVTCKRLAVRDWCRVDVRCDEAGVPNIIEVNPLPGILPKVEDNSCLPKAARAAGYSYTDLIQRVLGEALKRYGIRDEC